MKNGRIDVYKRQTYEGDLARAVEYVRSIEDLLTDTPLNVQLMNATLSDAIDYIYKLYNNRCV